MAVNILHVHRPRIGWTLQAEGAEGDVDKYIIANACALVGVRLNLLWRVQVR